MTMWPLCRGVRMVTTWLLAQARTVCRFESSSFICWVSNGQYTVDCALAVGCGQSETSSYYEGSLSSCSVCGLEQQHAVQVEEDTFTLMY